MTMAETKTYKKTNTKTKTHRQRQIQNASWDWNKKPVCKLERAPEFWCPWTRTLLGAPYLSDRSCLGTFSPKKGKITELLQFRSQLIIVLVKFSPICYLVANRCSWLINAWNFFQKWEKCALSSIQEDIKERSSSASGEWSWSKKNISRSQLSDQRTDQPTNQPIQ